MRKLIFGIDLSIDGCCDHTKLTGGLHEYFTDRLREVDTIVFGRITYQLMVPYWPDIAKNQSGRSKASNEFARVFDSIARIVVFSRSLEKVEDKKTVIVRSNLREEILKLKQEQGRDIYLGGVDLSSQIIKLGLVDEFHIVVQPKIVGEGRRLMDGISFPEGLQLKLVDAKTLGSGCVALHYTK